MAGVRLGLVRKYFIDDVQGHSSLPGTPIPTMVKAMHDTVATMRKGGADVIDVDMDVKAEERQVLLKTELGMWRSDFKEDMTAYLAGLKESPVRSVEELVKWNEDHAVSPRLKAADE